MRESFQETCFTVKELTFCVDSLMKQLKEICQRCCDADVIKGSEDGVNIDSVNSDKQRKKLRHLLQALGFEKNEKTGAWR